MRFTNYIENISSKRRKIIDEDNYNNPNSNNNISLDKVLTDNNNIENESESDIEIHNEEPKIGEIRLALLMESDIEYEDNVEKKYLWLLDGTEKELKNYLYYIIPLKYRFKCIISKAKFLRINEYSIGIPED